MSKTESKLNASLPIVEEDVVFKLDENRIKLGNVVYGEISSFPNGSSDQSQDGEITVMWHNDFVKDLRVPVSEVKLFENRCEIGTGVCSLKEQDKYGICLEIKSKVTCVVLDEENQDKRYLLNVDSNRLKHFSDISCDLCYFKNSIYEIVDIVYLMKLSFKDKIEVEIQITKRNFIRKFTILDDKYNKNDISKYFPNDKTYKLSYGEFVPFGFNEIIGKIVSVRYSELSKLKIDDQTIQLIERMDGKDANENDLKKLDANESDANESSKVTFSLEPNKEKKKNLKRVTLTVSDVQIGEVQLNCVKDFKKSDSQDFRAEKVSGNQLNKIKFFNISKRSSEIGSRCKLILNENDKLNSTNFKGYEDYLNKIVKSKLSNLPKAKQWCLGNLENYSVIANDCYEDQNKESKDFIKLVDTKSDDIMIEEDDDDIFLEIEQSDKQELDQQAKEDLRNNNLMMLNRLNRRSRSSSARTHSLNNRSTNERLMNSSFKKLKFNSSVDDLMMNEDLEVTDLKAFQDLESTKSQVEEKEVLVDILYSDTFVDIHWQDNTIERDIPLGHVAEEIDNLIPKFYPGNFVNYVGEQKSGVSPSYGVIQKVKQNANIAEVKWFYDDENLNESKSSTTLESLFNLSSSYMHYHLGDVVVDQCLLLDSSKFKVENLPNLIGTIKQISVDGTALVEWIAGEKTNKKLIELVSFFDVDFSDYSDNEDSFLSMNSDEMDSDLNFSDSICNSLDNNESKLIEKNSNNKLTGGFKFNSYKFEYSKNDFDSLNLDKESFVQKCLKKITKIFALIQESKDIQRDHLVEQGFYNQFNFEQDKKILNLSFEIIGCYYEKIKNNVNQFELEGNNESFDNFCPKFIYSLNNWLDLVQSQFDNFNNLLEENMKFKRTSLAILSKFTPDFGISNPFDAEQLKHGFLRIKNEVEDKENQKQLLNDFKKKMVFLINRFNTEVIINFSLTNDELNLGFHNDEITATNDLNASSSSFKSTKSNDVSSDPSAIKFKKINCISLEDNNIKHEFLKSSSKKQPKVNLNTLQKELNLLKSSLPDSGIYIRSFEERLDLFSLMIEGALDTVYENHLFLFDLKIQDEFLSQPPEVAYLPFGTQQINPNLYLDKNVCLSLLGTFFGKSEEERWIANKSSIYQLAMSLQALVLNKSPFFNEADFDVYSRTEEGYKKSKLYNEYVIVSLINYCIDLMAKKDNTAFKNEVQKYYRLKAETIYERYCDFVLVSMEWSKSEEKAKLDESLNDLEKERKFQEWAKIAHPTFELPTFTLLPGSLGFCLHLSKNLNLFLNEFREYLPANADLVYKKVTESVSSIQI